jgi:2-methylcitrate dehydratase PrpD
MLSAAHQIKPVSGARFLLGAILGYETGPRVGQALGGLDMLSRGWHSGVVFGTLSAAAAAGTARRSGSSARMDRQPGGWSGDRSTSPRPP